MIGDIQKITKSNLLKGIPWRFGPNWPGKRCEAITRKGTPCQRPAKLPIGRCRLPLRHVPNYVMSCYVTIPRRLGKRLTRGLQSISL